MSEIILSLTPPPLEALAIPKAVMPTFSSFYLIAAVVIVVSLAAILYAKRGKMKLIPLVLVMCFMLLGTPVQAYDFENPIDTTNIGLFAYYYNPAGWNLPTIASAFYSYTNHGLYYDGIVRIYYDCDGATWIGASPDYATINVRVREDGWIVAFFNYTQDAKFIPFFTWGCRYPTWTNPKAFSTYQTSLARAIWRFLYVAGQPLSTISTSTVKSTTTSKTTTTTVTTTCSTSETTTTTCTTTCSTSRSSSTSTITMTTTSITTTSLTSTSTNWIGYDHIGYYDYHYPTAIRLMLLQGYEVYSGYATTYRRFSFMVPQGTVYNARVIGYCWNWCYGYVGLHTVYFDAVLKLTGSGRELFDSADCTAECTTAKSHVVTAYESGINGDHTVTACAVMLIWAS